MLANTFFNDVSDVFQRGGQLLHLVEAKGDVVGDVALVTAHLESFGELVLSSLVLLLLVEDAALGNDGLCGISWQLADKRLGVGHFFKLVLDVHLNLDDLVSVLGIFDLGSNFAGFYVHASLKEGLGVVKLVLGDIRVELCELIVVLCRLCVVLHIEVAVGEQGKRGSTSG